MRDRTMYSTRCSLQGEPEEFPTLEEAERAAARLAERVDVQVVKVSVVATYKRTSR